MMSSPSTSSGQDQQQQQQQQSANRPKAYLILTNISKRQNVKNLLQLAAAYGVQTIFVVGQRAFEFDPDAEGGTDVPSALQNVIRSGKIKIIKFDKLEQCVQHVKSLPCDDVTVNTDGCDGTKNKNDEKPKKRTIPILGVEIDDSAVNLEEEPFTTSSIAFMMGNEGSGMTEKQMSVCDGFIRISQYGGGTASLNVSVAAGLVLHRFFHWSRGDDVKRYCNV